MTLPLVFLGVVVVFLLVRAMVLESRLARVERKLGGRRTASLLRDWLNAWAESKQ